MLATVKGDVHDIGKNLVDIILSNNGYKVVNLRDQAAGRLDHQGRAGSQSRRHRLERPAGEVDTRDEVRHSGFGAAEAGVSGDLRRRGPHAQSMWKMICDASIKSAVFYADDAFAGLHIMEDLVSRKWRTRRRLKEGKTVKEYSKAVAVDEETGPVFAERSAVVTDAPNIPEPPFWGIKVRKDYDLRELFQYINETALFKNQWQLKTASQEDYVRLVEEKYRPIKKQLEDDVIASGLFEPKVVYGYFPAQSDGNDVVVYEPEDASGRDSPRELLRFTFPRQREGRKLCISDFFCAKVVRKGGCSRLVSRDDRLEGVR